MIGLRGRFTLGFGLAAALTIVAAAAVTRQVVSSRYRAEFERTLAGAEGDARRAVSAQGEAVAQALAGLATRDSPIVGPVLLDLRKHDGELSPDQREELRRRGESIMRTLGVDVLTIVDRRGTVLAAPHFAAGVDEKDPLPAQVAAAKGAVLIFPRVMVGGQVARRAVLAQARTVSDGGATLTVLAGRIVGESLLVPLHRDGTLEAQLVDAQGKELAATERDFAARLAGAPSRRVDIAGPDGKPAARLVVAAPDTAVSRALADVTLASVAFGALATLLATLLGYFVARRITRELDALVAGAQAVARGNLSHQVRVQRRDELGDLASAFNAMTREIADSKERLVQAERVAAWQDIARSIAHEIKNPLTPIQMSIETLRKSFAAKHKSFEEIFEESTRTVLEETARLKRIVSEFSEFARLPRPAMTPLPLNELVGAALSLYRGHVKVVSELGDGLPDVSLDRNQMTQVILNLLENARDAITGKGSDESVGRIGVRTRRLGTHVVLEVEDNGPGFSLTLRDKLFEPYFTTKTGGTGLGLAIVRRIVTDHGGRVSATSEPGRGAKFVVELPAR